MKHKKRLLAGIGAIVLALFLIWAGHLAYRSLHLAQAARSLAGSLQSGVLDAVSIRRGLEEISGDLGAIRANLRPLYPLLRLGAGIPGLGNYLGLAEPLLEMGAPLAQAGSLVFNVLEPLMAPEAGGTPLTLTERLFSAVNSNQGTLNEAARLAAGAAAEKHKIDPQRLPSALSGYYERFEALFPLVQFGVPVLQALPELMGASGAQIYLVLAQNRDELRATGGFISGIGTFTLNRGKLETFQIGDSYAVDDFSKGYPAPPAALKQFMLADYWVPRDANWSPDFPVSAAQAQALYTLSTGVQTRGVVAFDQQAVKELLGVLGPLSLEGFPEQVTAANVEEFMRLSWAPGDKPIDSPEWWSNRKNFMGTLGKVILSQMLSSGSQAKLAGQARLALELVRRGHLQVYMNHPAVVTLLSEAMLDGGLHPAKGDFLLLVDSNVGFNKADPAVGRAIQYEADLHSLQKPSARLVISYTHNNKTAAICKQEATYGKGTYADMQARCYWDYWRVLAPTGSALAGSSVPAVPASSLLSGKDWPGQVETSRAEQGLAQFAGLMLLPTNSRQETVLQYSLPAALLERLAGGQWIYRLRLQKQAGLLELPVTVRVMLPEGAKPVEGQPAWAAAGGGAWSWSGGIRETLNLRLVFSSAGQP